MQTRMMQCLQQVVLWSNLCPDGTLLEGVAIDAASPDVSPADGIPDVCNFGEICPDNTRLAGTVVVDDGDPNTPLPAGFCDVEGLEKCPAGTDLVGQFAMGDGDLNTTTADDDAMLAANCDLGLVLCPAGTALEDVCNICSISRCFTCRWNT